ncbi:MAG: protein kinase domain-containing protein [Gemmatimonadales bacterium]
MMIGRFCPHCGGVHDPERGHAHHEGRTLPDGLRVLQALGPVSLGELYRAEDPISHVELDLVFLHPSVAARLRPQFARAAAITHPNVAGVRAVGQTSDGTRYVAFEVVRGELLSELIRTRPILPLTEAVDLVRQAASGLQAVHRSGLLHSNLSPETMLVARGEDGHPLVKLIRFGPVRYEPEPSSGGDPGIRYAAPERVAGLPLDERSDVFSLGAVLLHLLTGAPPNTGLATSEPVSDAAWSVISKALDPIPERRFPSAAAFAEALGRVTSRPRAWAWARAAGRGSRAAAAVGAALMVALAGLWVARNEERSRSAVAPVEAGAAGDTEPAPESRDSARPPPARVESAALPPRSGSPRRPSKAEPPALAVLKPTPPESLEMDSMLQEALRVQVPPIVVPPPLDTTPTTPTDVTPTAAAWNSSDAENRAVLGRVIATYAHALESTDLRSVEWAYPELTEREREAWKKFFSVARDLVVTLDVQRYAIAESEANLDVRGIYRYWNRSLHRSERAPVRFLATLKRSADGWRLTAIH